MSGDWSNAGNWQPSGVPTASDSVVIANGANVRLSQNASVADLNLSGTLSGTGTLTISGVMNWTSGDLRAGIAVAASGTLNISGDVTKHIGGGNLRNAGTVIWSGKGNLIGFQNGKIENTGTFDVRNDATLGFCCGYPVASFDNAGTFMKTAGTNTTAFSEFHFNNTGRVEARAGGIAIGSGQSNGSFDAAADSQIEFTSGTHTFANGVKITGAGPVRIRGGKGILEGTMQMDSESNFELAAGELGGKGQLEGSGQLNWTGGDLTGTIATGANLKMTISGAGTKVLRSGHLSNFGTAIWTGTGPIQGFAAGSITNAALFEIQNDASFTFCCAYPIAKFVNLPSGTIRKTSASGDTAFLDLLLLNHGTVDIQTGTLTLKGPEHRLHAGGRFSGAGRTRLLTAVSIEGTSTLAEGGTVELGSSGVLRGDGGFDGAGTFEWTGGDLRAALSLGADTQWHITGSAPKNLIEAKIQTAGTTLWSGSGPITGFSAGRIVNTGVFEAQNDSAANFCCAYPVATFHNAAGGVFRKSAGAGQTVFDNFIFDNDGLVEVLQGTLALGGGGTSTGTFSNSPNGSLSFTSGTMVLNSSSTSQLGGVNRIIGGATLTLNGTNMIPAGAIFELAGGVLNGTGRLGGSGTFRWSGGDLRAELTIAPETKMQITGAADKSLASGRLNNQGHVTWTDSGKIIGISGGAITNTGIFELQNDSAFSFCCAYPMAVFHNSGVLRKTSATGTSVFGDFIFQNAGLVDIQSGVLALRNQSHSFNEGGRFSGAGRTLIESKLTISGISTLESGGTVELRGTLSGDGGFSGPGTFEWSSGDLRATLEIGSGTQMLISGSDTKDLAGGVLNNAGRAIWTGTGTINAFSGGVINNTGIFDIKNDSVVKFCCAYPIGTFYNRPGALLRKTSKGQTAFRDFAFVNEGRLSIQGGILVLADGTAIPGVCPVKIPAALSIDLLPSNTEALLTWNHGGIEDGGDNLEFGGFELEKSVAGGAFEKIATLPPGTFRYVVPESCDGPVNHYRVRALSDGCNSGYSAAVTIPRPTEPPVFITKPQDLVAAEKLFVYDADATDPKGAKVVYVLLQGPAGMTIDSLTGKVQWTPPSALRGQVIPVTLMAFNGACGAEGTQSFTLAVGETPPPGGFKLRVGKVVMSADSLFRVVPGVAGAGAQTKSTGYRIMNAGEIDDGVYKVGGDIKINDYVHFDGSVMVKLDKAAATLEVNVDQGRVYLTNIPLVGNKTIWQGGNVSFTVDGNGEVTRLLQEQLEKPLQAAGMDIHIERARLLLDEDLGIRIFGKLEFPDVYGFTALSGHFDNLEISRRNGVRFTGQIRLGDFDLGGMAVRNTYLRWMPQEDPTYDVFEGEGDLITPAFALACKVRLVGGGLDGVYANFDSGAIGIPVPPAPAPFFNITGGGLGIEGLRGGPFSVRMDVNLTLVHPSMKNVISLNKAGITYTYPSRIKGSGDLRILNAKAAKAFLNLDLPYRFGLGGKVDLIEQFPVLIIEADMSAGINPDPLQFFFEGGASGKLQIPPYDNFPHSIKKAFPPLWLAKPFLPKTLAEAKIAYRNSTFSTSIGLPVVGDIVVAVKHAQNQVQLLVGQNLSSLTKVIGFSPLQSGGGFHTLDPEVQKSMISALGRDRETMGGGHLEGDGLFIPAAATPGSEIVASVHVPPAAPRVIFRLFGEAGTPRFQLITPDGGRLTPANLNGAHYQESPETKETYYVVVEPTSGEWTIEAEDASQGPFVLDAWGANSPPVIASLAATQTGGAVTINYNVADPDDSPAVSLFYDNDAAGFDGAPIAENLPAGATGQYVWNVPADLPTGTYSIYAVVDDEKNAPALRYATGTISVIDPNAPASPKNLKVQPGGENSLIVSWDANSEPDLRGYQIQFGAANGATPEEDNIIDAGNTNVYRLTKLKSETAYRISVLAYTQNEAVAAANTGTTLVIRKSLATAPVTATTEAAQAPTVRVTSPNGDEQLIQNSSIMVSWKVEDADDIVDQQVELSTDAGQTWRPLAKRVSAEKRNFSWDIPAGLETSRARIRVSVVDRAGNEGIDASDANFSVTGADTDGDTLPDQWELAHGFDPNQPGDDSRDRDNDGLTNLQEYIAGTNPTDPSSAFRVLSAASGADGIQISFTTVAGKTYRLECTPDLAAGQWIVIGPDIIGTGELHRVTDPGTSSTSKFYRILVTE